VTDYFDASQAGKDALQLTQQANQPQPQPGQAGPTASPQGNPPPAPAPAAPNPGSAAPPIGPVTTGSGK